MREWRSRVFLPLLLSAILFGLYFLALWNLDIQTWDTLLGKDFRNLLFAAFVPLIFLVVRLLDGLIFDVILSRRRNMAVPRLLRDVVALCLYFALFTWATSQLLEFSITKWLAAGTVIAAILGLALQETLGNLFSGIALHMEDSFMVGDVLRSGDQVGVIEGVTWRATRLRTFNNNVIILPNSLLARERLEVYPRDRVCGRTLTVGVDYNVPPATVISILTQAASHVDGVSREIPCFARVSAFGDSAVNYDIKYYTRDYATRDRIDAEIRKAVWYALRRNSISIPFPIRAYQRYQPSDGHDHELSPEDIRDRLQQVDILAALDAKAQKALVAAARVRQYSRGETILRIATAGDSMFIVHEGTVSVRLADDTKNGRHEVAQLGPGSVFGEMALLTGESRTADVIAM
ncbi:MAG TPA: mechanosensitive ion channel family protein, partial [Thermoanaerobaculia bacterium]